MKKTLISITLCCAPLSHVFANHELNLRAQKSSVEVIFKDGRRETGKIIRRSKSTHILDGELKKIWFNKESIENISPLDENDAPVIYRRLPEGQSNRKALGSVIHELKWGRWNTDGSISFKGKDFKLGPVEDIFETKRFSARLSYLDGKKYKWPIAIDNRLELTFHNGLGLTWHFFNQLASPKNFKEKLNRIRFTRQSEQFAIAKLKLDSLLPASEEEKEEINLERKRIEKAEREKKSIEEKRTTGLGPRTKINQSILEKTSTEYQKLSQWWQQGAPPTEIENLVKALSPHKISKDDWPKIIQSLPFPSSEITPGKSQVRQWQWEQQAREYSIYLPKFYSTDKLYACAVVLHGQGGSDENFIRRYIPYADQFNIIILSAEYVYGRKYGYRYHREDMQAITGALQDARWRFAIDPNRVHLIGLSQGGHTAFDVSQSFVNEFAASSMQVGAPYRTQVQLAHQKDHPMYIICGELDGHAPKICRQAIAKLLNMNSPSVYVEYKKRGHEYFREEVNNMWFFLAQQKRKPWRKKIESYWARNGEGARGWLRIPEGVIQNDRIKAISKSSLLKLSGQWKKERVKIKADKRLKEFEVLVSDEYIAKKKPLKIFVNGKEIFKEKISGFDLKDYLNEVAQSKDRWTPVRQVIKVSL